MITKGRCFPEAFLCFQEKSEHLPGAHLNHICSSLLQQNLTVKERKMPKGLHYAIAGYIQHFTGVHIILLFMNKNLGVYF